MASHNCTAAILQDTSSPLALLIAAAGQQGQAASHRHSAVLPAKQACQLSSLPAWQGRQLRTPSYSSPVLQPPCFGPVFLTLVLLSFLVLQHLHALAVAHLRSRGSRAVQAGVRGARPGTALRDGSQAGQECVTQLGRVLEAAARQGRGERRCQAGAWDTARRMDGWLDGSSSSR